MTHVINPMRDETYPLSSGDFRVHGFDLDFLETLQEMPVGDKMQLMLITPEEAVAYAKKALSDLAQVAIKLLVEKWQNKETGERVTFDTYYNDFAFGLPYSRGKIIGMLKRGSLNPAQIRRIINFINDELNPL